MLFQPPDVIEIDRSIPCGVCALLRMRTARAYASCMRYHSARIHFSYHRRATREVKVGNVGIGGDNPIRVQSMITCDTMDTEASIQQTMELAEAGCEIVRITAPTVKDARNLEHIVKGLRERGCDVPIVADIHFKPEAAMEAAKWVEKVRINPGNYADSKKFMIREYSDEQYGAELNRIRERFSPLVELCKTRGIAMRIGTNHGSLSDRILNRYGDTPLGMVESALEFARIARDLDYHDFVFSMKASNPKVMIAAYRLLVARLNELVCPDWNYPLHLGVTEAGEGEDARIKSAIGIGSLLADGIGDTIRVSLTEDSPHEIPVAKALIENIKKTSNAQRPTPNIQLSFDPFSYQRRGTETISVAGIGDPGQRIKLGGAELIRVVVRQTNFDKIAHKIDRMGDYKPEIVYEDANVTAIDPRDDETIAKLNAKQSAQFVTVTDGIDLPVIAAFRLLAAKLHARHPILLKDVFRHSERSRGIPPQDLRVNQRAPSTPLRSAQDDSNQFLNDSPHRFRQHRLPAMRRHRRRDLSARRGSAGASTSSLLQHSAGSWLADFQNGLCGVPILRTNTVQSANYDSEN